MKNKDSYLAANYNKLRFKYQLDVQLLVNDTELIELLLGKLEDVDELRSEIEYLETRISDLYHDIGNLEDENRELNSLLNKNDLF